MHPWGGAEGRGMRARRGSSSAIGGLAVWHCGAAAAGAAAARISLACDVGARVVWLPPLSGPCTLPARHKVPHALSGSRRRRRHAARGQKCLDAGDGCPGAPYKVWIESIE